MASARRAARLAAAAALALALAACDHFSLSSDGVVVVGFVDGGGTTTLVIEAPETVGAGTAFDVTINTFGSSSCTTPVRADVSYEGLVARIVPYDRVPAEPGTPCTADWGARPHPVELVFPAPGTATIEVHARTAGANGAARDTVVRRTVTVR